MIACAVVDYRNHAKVRTHLRLAPIREIAPGCEKKHTAETINRIFHMTNHRASSWNDITIPCASEANDRGNRVVPRKAQQTYSVLDISANTTLGSIVLRPVAACRNQTRSGSTISPNAMFGSHQMHVRSTVAGVIRFSSAPIGEIHLRDRTRSARN